MCIWRVQLKPIYNMDSLKILNQLWPTLARFYIFQFLEAIPRGFLLSYFSHKLTPSNLFWGITELNPRNLRLLKILPQNVKFMLQILDKKWLSREVWDPKKWHTKPLYTKTAWLNIHTWFWDCDLYDTSWYHLTIVADMSSS